MPQISHRSRAAATAVAATAAAAALALSCAPAATAAQSGSAPRLSVLTYNTFLMSKNLYPNWGQDHRAAEIPKASFFQGRDVVVLQEAFDNGASDALKANAAAQYPYQTPVVGRSKSGWDATGGSYSATTPEDGGVTILSKWPVLRKEQVIYKDACGSDWWSNKGFAYVVLDVNGTKVHVVGTHAQSTDSGCGTGEAAQMRSRQFKAIDAFLDAKNIPADEQVIVAGDMNVDSRSPEYSSMLTDLDLAPADTRTGHPYSFDTALNSIANYRYPTDPREDLDYVLYRKGNARPSGWENNVVKEESTPWTVSSWGTSYTYSNLSDHYPVVGR
ncbi:sphingomyelin phosphodiesterase [Streptomyces sp. 3211.6]|uniref:sphingomyelin phosphodiesterase n=1 Tax=Streptomyces TaxID=1883 RepID=UPI0009A47A1A|nr:MULTISPECIES: sphingomyelin phosphodiesterase [Streptomyces]RKT07866.1 sphingomyelin phosphodiesterase [Streptomyces sp. 3211.6]RPF44512.1 sphingomyelin phosphodiesterase [Streptomyces sp. Ag109_G2-6]